MADSIQFDTSDKVLSGKNLLEGENYDCPVYFNESYIITGDFSATKIYCAYDLTVLGNLNAESIEVKGDLVVTGKIKSNSLVVDENLLCSEEVCSEIVNISGNIQAESIKCKELISNGNVVVQTTVKIDSSLNVENILVATEGLIGKGEIQINQLITGEYFDFDGDITGNVLDLGEDKFSYSSCSNDKLSFDDKILDFQKDIKNELAKCDKIDEEDLKGLVKRISCIDDGSWSEWSELLEKIIALSYKKKIKNFKDYLLVLYASKIFPQSIISYETISHVFYEMFKSAEEECFDLDYKANNIEEFYQSLKIISVCKDELAIELDLALDKMFQSVGIKYNTVKRFFKDK